MSKKDELPDLIVGKESSWVRLPGGTYVESSDDDGSIWKYVIVIVISVAFIIGAFIWLCSEA